MLSALAGAIVLGGIILSGSDPKNDAANSTVVAAVDDRPAESVNAVIDAPDQERNGKLQTALPIDRTRCEGSWASSDDFLGVSVTPDGTGLYEISFLKHGDHNGSPTMDVSLVALGHASGASRTWLAPTRLQISYENSNIGIAMTCDRAAGRLALTNGYETKMKRVSPHRLGQLFKHWQNDVVVDDGQPILDNLVE